jgi:hypothetical protein
MIRVSEEAHTRETWRKLYLRHVANAGEPRIFARADALAHMAAVVATLTAFLYARLGLETKWRMRRARSKSFCFPFGIRSKTSGAVKRAQSGFELGVAHPPGQASGFLIS